MNVITLTLVSGQAFYVGADQIRVGDVRGSQDFYVTLNGGPPIAVAADCWAIVRPGCYVQATYGRHPLSRRVRVRIDTADEVRWDDKEKTHV